MRLKREDWGECCIIKSPSEQHHIERWSFWPWNWDSSSEIWYFLWPGDTMIDSSIDTQMVKRSMWYGMEEQWLKLMKAALLGPAAFRDRWENGHTFTETHIHIHAPPPNDRHWHISVELWAISFQRLPLEDFSISACYKERDWRLWRLEKHHWRDPVTSISESVSLAIL